LEQFRQTYQTALAQRDEAIAKLGAMEGEFQRQMVSSQNLQSVIEQLQLGLNKKRASRSLFKLFLNI
jgi:hypothetical protein